ncbi:bifunctional hydroxymethylpyrimidine kinase/phosphomethylpyrimidine kinase [Sphingosinicella sp.]|uniref:bifunctional hydroxymethylpyrimidine kinase/phosphomethylpyrimidine kinase n=1 Tax=Sphingosinicella sp. TaxID=1917971 RepID=UPI0040379F3A
MTPPRILIIAGSDSGGGAGIQADIKTVTMLGGYAMTAVTALTAQNTLGVQDVMPVPAEFVAAQVDSALDLGVDVVKIGMLATPEIARTVETLLRFTFDNVPIVFDPVMVATSGDALNEDGTFEALCAIAELATVITPNLMELELLADRAIGSDDELEVAARAFADDSGRAVLAKGGHLEGNLLTDILVQPDGQVRRWTDARIETRHTHGTGCTLASAIATGLGHGLALPEAVDQARAYVRAALLAAPCFGEGNGPVGHTLGEVPLELINRKNN